MLAQAIEPGLGILALDKFYQVGADESRDRGTSFRSCDAGESLGLFIDGYGDVLHRHTLTIIVSHTIYRTGS